MGSMAYPVHACMAWLPRPMYACSHGTGQICCQSVTSINPTVLQFCRLKFNSVAGRYRYADDFRNSSARLFIAQPTCDGPDPSAAPAEEDVRVNSTCSSPLLLGGESVASGGGAPPSPPTLLPQPIDQSLQERARNRRSFSK